jgi:thiamine pyrophosphate-dependent acetolactate synthase large subunit-like protein
VVEALAHEGVRHAFGIPGVHNLAIYDALLRQRAIAHVLARHEQGAAFMADGYARASGAPGVVIVTSGPAATNTITPLAESYSGSVPVVVIMSDIASHLVGRDLGALHEVRDQIECFRPVTRRAQALGDAAAIPAAIAGAFALQRTGRPGPVAMSIPNDVLTASAEAAVVPAAPAGRPACDAADVRRAAQRLREAARPLIVAGGGVAAAGAASELVAIAQRLEAPVVTTVSGRGTISERHPLWHSVLPDRRATAPALAEADVVLAVGTKLGHRSMEKLGTGLGAAGQTLIHLDLDPRVIGRLYKAELALVGDARDGLRALVTALGPEGSRASWDRPRLAALRADAGPRFTREVAGAIAALRRALPDDAVVVNDQTGLTYWMELRFPVLRPRTFLYPTGSAVLGYAVPAAIGAKLACPTRPVLAVAGDGGFMFSVAELATAVKYRLGVVFLVVNDDRYGAIRYLQQRLYAGRWGEAELTNPDFVALAHAFGACGERLPAIDALPDALARALRSDRPTVLELRLSLEPPWEL